MIYVEGCIGVGKSTFIKPFAEYLNAKIKTVVPTAKPNKVYAETVRPAFLTPFYADLLNEVKPSFHAFRLQFRVLADRFWQHFDGVGYEVANNPNKSVRVHTLHDRSLPGDRAFVELLHDDGYIQDDDYKTYMDMQRLYMEGICRTRPSLCIYLKASPATCLKRLRERENKYEVGVKLEYLADLQSVYEGVVLPAVEDMGTQVVTIDWETYKEPEQVAKYLRRMDAGEANDVWNW